MRMHACTAHAKRPRVQTTTTNRKGRAEGIDCCLLVVLMKKGGGLDKQTNI